MNTASSTPVRTAEYSTPNGESQLSSGEIESAGTLSKIRRDEDGAREQEQDADLADGQDPLEVGR